MNAITTVPDIQLWADGQRLRDATLAALSEVRVQQRLSQPTQCELIFRQAAGLPALLDALATGVALRVVVGATTDALFAGEVSAVEYLYTAENEQELYVRGYDALARLRRAQHVRSYPADITLQRLAQDLARSAGIAHVDCPPATLAWPWLMQHQQNDLDLLVECAAQNGLYLTLDGDCLRLVDLQGQGALLPLVLGEALLDAHFEVNQDGLCDQIVASGWNPLRVESFQGQATIAPVTPAGVNGAATAPSVRHLLNEQVGDQVHVRTLAQAELAQRRAGAATFSGAAMGDSALRPGVPVTISGVAPALAGRYLLTAATHTIDSEAGYRTELSTVPPALPVRPRSDVATVGIVSSVADPEGLGRVKATLPAYGQVETSWMTVLAPGAGNAKGLTALPDRGDSVLILLLRENPGQGIVLGGLYGRQKPPDCGVAGSRVRRHSWITPGGQTIRLDDDQKGLRLQSSGGAYIELADEKITIVGNKIDFKQISLLEQVETQVADLQRKRGCLNFFGLLDRLFSGLLGGG